MIINCINCNKNFEVDPSLIPDKGRTLRCGSCNHTWFFTPELNKSTKKSSNDKSGQDDFSFQEKISINIGQNIDKNKSDKEVDSNIINNKRRPSSINKFFSYIVVFFISLVALIIFIDTIKVPLINIIPSFEIVLFNLFETLKDIKLFIIDLF
tara:strand:- start:375 stop:833 length:459 start_codon:yes stop_codon:yes gene_type:complete